MISRRRFLTIAAAAAVSSGAQATPVQWRGFALGAEVGVTLSLPPNEARPLFHRIHARLAHIEKLFSLYDPASCLSELNQTGLLASPPGEMLDLLRHADRLYRATNGRFDPTIQPLWQALAGRTDSTQARAAIGWNRVRLAEDLVQIGAGQALTLNGIAQGFATDLIAGLLAQAGLARVLVNIGEFSGRGGPWKLGVADPVHGLVAQRTLYNSAIATSSPGALLLEAGHEHILDPTPKETGTRWSTVSVEATTATIADGLSTALCLATQAQARDIVRKLPEVHRATLVARDGTLTVIGRRSALRHPQTRG